MPKMTDYVALWRKYQRENVPQEIPIERFHKLMGKDLVFSDGGFFRFFPYTLIKYRGKQTPDLMTDFHPRDFDFEQPIVESLRTMRKFKSYVEIKKAFPKFQRLLNDFDFVNIEQANDLIDWDKTRLIKI